MFSQRIQKQFKGKKSYFHYSVVGAMLVLLISFCLKKNSTIMVDLLEVSSKELNKLFSKATKQWKKPLKQVIFSACPRNWIFSTSGSCDKHSSFALVKTKFFLEWKWRGNFSQSQDDIYSCFFTPQETYFRSKTL